MKLIIKENKEARERFLDNIGQVEPVYKELIKKVGSMGVELTNKDFQELLKLAYVHQSIHPIPVDYTERISEFLKEKLKAQSNAIKDLPIESSIVKVKGLPAFIEYLYKANSGGVNLSYLIGYFSLDKGSIKQNKDAVDKRLDSFNIYADNKAEKELASMMQEISSLVNDYIERKEKITSSYSQIDLYGFKFESGRLELDPTFIKTYAGKF